MRAVTIVALLFAVTAVLATLAVGVGLAVLLARQVARGTRWRPVRRWLDRRGLRLRAPGARRRVRIDPGTLSRRWAQPVRRACAARRRMAAIVATSAAGPVREQLQEALRDFDRGLASAWQMARRGDALQRAAGDTGYVWGSEASALAATVDRLESLTRTAAEVAALAWRQAEPAALPAGGEVCGELAALERLAALRSALVELPR